MPKREQREQRRSGTGTYAICPNSNVVHPGLVAREVFRGPSGTLWFRCSCGFRGYFLATNPLLHKRDAILAAGVVIPDELVMLMPPPPPSSAYPPTFAPPPQPPPPRRPPSPPPPPPPPSAAEPVKPRRRRSTTPPQAPEGQRA